MFPYSKGKVKLRALFVGVGLLFHFSLFPLLHDHGSTLDHDHGQEERIEVNCDLCLAFFSDKDLDSENLQNESEEQPHFPRAEETKKASCTFFSLPNRGPPALT